MGSVRLCLVVFVILHALVLLPMPAHCDEEDNLVQGINSYRQSKNLQPLAKNDNANCLADEIADKLDDRPCTRSTGASTVSGRQPQYANYHDILEKCNIDINTTADGVILPVCVPKRVQTLVLTNYTQSPYAAYLNNSKYTGFGIGKEDDWVVLVLTMNTPSGSFANAASFISEFVLSQYLMPLLLGWFVVW